METRTKQPCFSRLLLTCALFMTPSAPRIRRYEDIKLTFGIRSAAIRLFHNLYLNVGDLVPDGDRRSFIHPWGGGKEPNVGSYDFSKMQPEGDVFHQWLVGTSSSDVTDERSNGFPSDLIGFMVEMKHVVRRASTLFHQKTNFKLSADRCLHLMTSCM